MSSHVVLTQVTVLTKVLTQVQLMLKNAYQPPQVWFSGRMRLASPHPQKSLRSVKQTERCETMLSTSNITHNTQHTNTPYLIHPVILDTKFPSKSFGIIWQQTGESNGQCLLYINGPTTVSIRTCFSEQSLKHSQDYLI